MIGSSPEQNAPSFIGAPAKPSSFSIFHLYGFVSLVWAASALIGYLIWLSDRSEIHWKIPLKSCGILLCAPVCAVLVANLPSFHRFRMSIFFSVLGLGLLTTWLCFSASLVYPGWFFAAALWVGSGAIGVDALLRSRGLRYPMIVPSALFLASLILLQAIFSAFRLADPWLLISSGHALLVLIMLRKKPPWKNYWFERWVLRKPFSIDEMFQLGMLITAVAFFLFVSQIPESASDVRVYLPMLRDYLIHGGYAYHPWIPFSYYPNGWYHLFFVFYGLGGEPGAKAFNVFLSVIVLVGLYALMRRIVRNRSLSLFAAFGFYTLPMFQWLWYTLYQEAATFIFLLAGFVLMMDFTASAERKHFHKIIVAGGLIGFALACKLTPSISFASALLALGVLLLRAQWQSGFQIQKAISIVLLIISVGVIAVVVSAPSWIPVFRLTGDPLFPMLTPFTEIGKIPQPLPNSDWCRDPFKWGLLPFYATFHSWYAIDYHLDGSLGPWLFMLFPFIPLNLSRNSPQRRFLLIFLIIFWALMYLGRENSTRYHLLFYAAAIGSCFSGVRIWLRQAGGLRLRFWPGTLAAGSVLNLLLCLVFGFVVSFNFSDLRQYLKIIDPFSFNQQQWPDFNKVSDFLDRLPQKATAAMTTNYGMMVCQLPRYTFTFETNWLKRDLHRLGWNNPAGVLHSSGAAVEILPLSDDPQSPSFLDWPEKSTWRRPANLLMTGPSLIFAMQPGYAENASEISLNQLAGHDRFGSMELQWGQSGELQTLELKINQPYAGFTAQWETPTSSSVDMYETGPGRLVPMQSATDVALGENRYFYRAAFDFSHPALHLRSTVPWSQTTCTLAFFDRFKYPAPRVRTMRPTVFLPQKWQGAYNQTHLFENDVWFRSGCAPKENGATPIPVSKGRWLCYRFHGLPCKTLQAYMHIKSMRQVVLNLDLREEDGHFINRRVQKTYRRQLKVKPGDQDLLVEWPCPVDPENLTLVFWPECGEGEFTYYSGVINFLQ